MLEAPGGGGGTVVLIDPSTLRHAAARVKITSQELQLAKSALAQISTPAMPSSVAAVVLSALAEADVSLGPLPPGLDQLVIELTRRAFWAEFADQLLAGYNLSGTALQEFKAWMKDGTLLQYADEGEAIAAGRELAVAYSGFRKDPQLLIDLALSLKASEAKAAGAEVERAFGAGFVNQFGAKNMLLVPRMIQAMEWSRQITFEMGITNPNVLHDVALSWEENGKTLQQDPIKDLLAPFCITLANATCSGMLAPGASSAIADSEDTWATAALVSQGTFATPFLLQCFKSGVVDKIVEDSRSNLALGGTVPETDFPLGEMWSQGKESLPFDTKQTILDALARNPDAAAQALSQPIDAQPFDVFGQRETITNPIELLYRYGDFADHGAAFGHVYVTATDHLPPAEASKLTVTALTQLVGYDHGGMSAFKDGIATDLADHHIKDLFDSAASLDTSSSIAIAPSGADGAGEIELGRQNLTTVIAKLADRPSAFQTLLHAGATYQAALIDQGTQSPPVLGSSPVWAHKIGSFDATVLNATDLNRWEDFHASDERHQLVLGFFKDVTNGVVALDDPVADAVVHTGVDQAFDKAFPGPDPLQVSLTNADAKLDMINSIRASIAAGYYDHGQIHVQLPPDLQGTNGHLKAYGSLDVEAKRSYERWMHENQQVADAVGPAAGQVSDAFTDQSIDFGP
jgi:hypothetical protein